MPQENSPIERPHQRARAYLAGLLGLLRAADVGIGLFIFGSASAVPALSGLLVGCALCTTALLLALWHNSSWARFILILFNWAVISVFSLAGLIHFSDPFVGSRQTLIPLALGLCGYVAANIVLIKSRRLHRLGHPRSCGS